MAERRRERTRTSTRSGRRERRRKPTMDDRLDAIVDAAYSIAHSTRAIAIVLVIIVVVMLYGPTRDYYVAMRSGQDLQARLEAVDQQNELLREDIGRLQSEEGIEDEAARRGYVKDGDTPVITENVPKEDQTALVGDIELEDTRPWYVKVLDVVFFYSAENWQ